LGYIGIPAVASESTEAKKKVRTAVDMSVVIRTAVLSVPPVANAKDLSEPVVAGKKERLLDFRFTLAQTTFSLTRRMLRTLDLSVGAGGALTILSDAKEEWREVLLKSRSVVPR